jgi:hypothetical protein
MDVVNVGWSRSLLRSGALAAVVALIVLAARDAVERRGLSAADLVTALAVGAGVTASSALLLRRAAGPNQVRYGSPPAEGWDRAVLGVPPAPAPMGRFDKFTDRARKVLTFAQDEAARFNHNYIGTEHLLLGLVREGEGVAARVLENMNVELPKVRTAVEFIIGRGDRPVVGEVGLTSRAKRVIELAIDEARRLGHNYIGTEHLLLGLVREGEGIAAGVLESLGVNLEEVRHEVIRVLSDRPAGDD